MTLLVLIFAGTVLYKFGQVGLLFLKLGFNKSVALFMGLHLLALGFAYYLMAANDFSDTGLFFGAVVMGLMLPSLINLTKKQPTKAQRKSSSAHDVESFGIYGSAEDDKWDNHSWTTENASGDSGWGGGSDGGGGGD